MNVDWNSNLASGDLSGLSSFLMFTSSKLRIRQAVVFSYFTGLSLTDLCSKKFVICLRT